MRWIIVCCGLLSSGGICAAQDTATPTAAAPAPSTPAPSPTTAASNDKGGKPPEIDATDKLPDGPERTKALADLNPVLKAWAERDPIAALTWLQTVKSPTASPWSTVLVASGQKHGKEAAEWSLQTTGHPFIHPLLFCWSSDDPQAAAAWCVQAQKPDDIRYLMYFSVGDGATYKDPAFAVPWMEKLESEEDRLAAIRGIMLRWPPRDVQAATNWIKQQKGEELRVAATAFLEYNEGKFKAKDGTKDVAAIKAWLDQLPLSDADKESAQKGMGFDVYRGPPKK